MWLFLEPLGLITVCVLPVSVIHRVADVSGTVSVGARVADRSIRTSPAHSGAAGGASSLGVSAPPPIFLKSVAEKTTLTRYMKS